MAAEAVGYDEFGNEVDAEGNIIPVRASFPDEELEGLTPKQKMERQMRERREEIATGKQAKQWAREGRARRIAQVRERGTPQQLAAVLEEEGTPSTGTEVTPSTGTEVGNYLGVPGPSAPTGPDYWSAAVQELRRAGLSNSEAVAQVKETMKKQAELRATQAGELAIEKEAEAERYAKETRAYETLQAAHRQGMDAAQTEIDIAERDLTSFAIDPNRAFKSTGSQVAAALAIAAGAFATGLSRGQVPNTALKIIEGAIARDIDAQKSEMQKRKDVLKNKHNVYAKMLSRFGREDVAKQMTINMGLKKAKMDLATLMTKHVSQGAQLSGQYMIDQLDLKITQGDNKIKEAISNIYMERAKAGAKAARGGTGRKGGPNDPLTMAKSVLSRIPMLARQFGEISKAQGWGSMMPRVLQDWIPGMAKASSYEDSRNLMAKEVVRAFDGGRPTEKDFQILAAMFPKAHAHKVVGQEKFENVMNNLNTMIGERGGLERGMLEKAANMAGFEPGKASVSAGSAMYNLAEDENWATFRAE